MKIWLSFHGRWPAGRLRKACADPCATPCAKLFSYGNYNCLKSTLPQHRCTFKHAAQNAFCALLLNTAATRVTSWPSRHSELTSPSPGALFRACHHGGITWWRARKSQLRTCCPHLMPSATSGITMHVAHLSAIDPQHGNPLICATRCQQLKSGVGAL